MFSFFDGAGPLITQFQKVASHVGCDEQCVGGSARSRITRNVKVAISKGRLLLHFHRFQIFMSHNL